MIVCYSKVTKSRLIVEHVINNYDNTNHDLWHLLGIGHGFDTAIFLVQANHVDEILDEYANHEISKVTRIKPDKLNRYLQEGRSYLKSEIQSINGYIDDIESQIEEPEFSNTEALQILNDMQEVIETAISDIQGLKWDSDDPYDGLTRIGRNNEYHRMDIRILEPIPSNQIHFGHENCSTLELDHKPFIGIHNE